MHREGRRAKTRTCPASLPLFLPLACLLCLPVARAQQIQPDLAPCGSSHANTEILCGTHAPEDLEPTPDGRYLIVSQLAHKKGTDEGEGLQLFNIATKTFSKIAPQIMPDRSWGDPNCPGPLGDRLEAHGISLTRRSNGVMELYAINRNTRNSMEMFELKRERQSWTLIWHGCEVSPKEFNDVAALPDGGFIASHPTSLMIDPGDKTLRYSGMPIGVMVHWTAARGEQELPGTRVGYPNGVVVSQDGRYLFFNAWTARTIHKYDLQLERDVKVVNVDFMPDNLSWIGDSWKGAHRILAAGVMNVNGDCPKGSGRPCVDQFAVAEVDPATMKVSVLYRSSPDTPLIAGTSVAVQLRGALYVGAYMGDRLVKIDLKRP